MQLVERECQSLVHHQENQEEEEQRVDHVVEVDQAMQIFEDQKP